MGAWLTAAVGNALCVDRLMRFIRALAPEDQVRIGLPWVATVVLGDPTPIARRRVHCGDLALRDPPHRRRHGAVEQVAGSVDALVVAGVSQLAPYSD